LHAFEEHIDVLQEHLLLTIGSLTTPPHAHKHTRIYPKSEWRSMPQDWKYSCPLSVSLRKKDAKAEFGNALGIQLQDYVALSGISD
jgi:hypothetical protein